MFATKGLPQSHLRRSFALFFGAWALCITSFAVPFAVPSPAYSQSRAQVQFDVPAGRLSSSIRILARQAGISIASRDAGIRRIRAKAVRGRMSVSEALRRLLNGTPYRAVAVRGGYRIDLRPTPRSKTPSSRVPAPAPSVAPAAPRPSRPPPPPPQPIIVEGTKRAQAVADYPGGVKVIALTGPGSTDQHEAGQTLDGVLGDVPSANGTALGSGRNKVFLRGIADSSFNGPTQSTIGLYLGEQRLLFSAPNPDLRLYDVESVELLEGPQGTLYGAGTIAGLLRVNPRQPDPTSVSGEGWAGLGLTDGGGVNWKLGAVGNAPISENAAIRMLAYSGQDSGFIEDPSRRLADINGSDYYGGRATFAADLTADWQIEVSGFGQHIESNDGQYVDQALDGLTRTDRVAQPFRGRIYGAGATIRGYLGDSELVSTTSFVDHMLRSTFDSSILTNGGQSRPGIQTFREARKIRLINHETRISGGSGEPLSWLVGVSALRNRDEMQQLITNLNGDDPPPFAELTYRLDEVAAFGEASYSLTPTWSITGGARVLYTSAVGERSFGPNTVVEPREGPVRVLPAAALSWKPSANWLTYLRYQEGFRTGGVTIERDGNRDPTIAQFDPDRVQSYELGVRGRLGEASPFDFALTLYHSKWRDIQADFIDQVGFPITRNIGEGTVTGIDGSVSMETNDGWRWSLAGAWNDSSVDRQLAQGGLASVAIPNVPDFSLNTRIAKVWSLTSQDEIGLALAGRYMGQSFVDLDQLVRDEQGEYGSIDLSAWWASEAVELRVDATNLTNTVGNRFAFGNPFTARTEKQATPLRPFTVQFQLTFKH